MNFAFLGAAALLVVPVMAAAAEASGPAVIAADRARYPDANLVVLLSDQSVQVNATGGYVSRVTTRRRVLTEEGRKEAQTHAIDFNRAYGYAKLISLRVLKADGRSVEADPAKQSAEQQNPDSAAANIYDPNDRRITVSVPDVEVGDTVELVYEQAETKPRMKGCYADIISFEGMSPVLSTRFRVVTPKSLPLLRTAIKGGDASRIRHTRTEGADTIEYVWESGETPQLLPEPMMPAPHLCSLRLLVSTVPDWQTVSRWYAGISEPHFASTPAIKAKVAELLAGVDDREERIRRVYRFVSQEIRYMGVIAETDAPGYEPHDVALTFDKRYGVCRDKAALLAVMLREAGLDAHPVLILAGGDHLDREVPLPYFNHAITAVREPDGSYRLMDATNENTKDIFPAYLSDCSYLVAHPQGDTLRVAPVPDAAAHLVTGETAITLRKDGTAAGETTLRFNGLTDTVYRGAFSQARPEDIHRHVQDQLAQLLPGARVTAVDLQPENLPDTTRPMSLTVRFEVGEYFDRREGKAFVRTPVLAALFDLAFRQIRGASGLEQRRFPVKLNYVLGMKERVTVTLPEGFGDTLSLPDALKLRNAGFSYERNVSRSGDKLTCDVGMRIAGLGVPVADYPAMRADLQTIERASRKQSLLALTDATRPDSHLTRSKVAVAIGSAGSSEVRVETRRRILTYAGKKDHAELRLSWNTAHPEPQLLKAVVRDAAGKEYAVGASEINVLDAEWVSAAPRYTPSRTKVISLPKVEIGSEIELAYTQSRTGFPSMSSEHVFADADPTDLSELEITAPADLPLYFNNRADAAVAVKDGRVVIRAAHPVAPAPRETAATPASQWAPSVRFATVRDEAAYAALVRPLLEPKATPDDAVRRKAAELLAGVPENETARLVVLRDFVAKSIRPAGPAWGEIPHDGFSGAARTLADGYGAETDRQLLFCALARAAGFVAAPVLIDTDPADVARRRYGEVFTSGFDRVGTRVALRDGAAVFGYLDEYAHPRVSIAPGSLVLDLTTGRSAVVVPPQGLGNTDSAQYRITLSENGDAEAHLTRVFSGEGATHFSRQIGEMRREDRKRYEFNLLQSLARDAKSLGAPEIHAGQPASVRTDAMLPAFMVMQERYAYFNLPQAPGGLFAGASEFARKLPYAVSEPESRRLRWEVTLPKGWKPVDRPADLEWSGPAGCGTVSLRRRVSADAAGNRRLSVAYDVALNPADISPAAFPALVELNRRVTAADTWRVLLEKDDAPATKP